jgi:hypothetical protein
MYCPIVKSPRRPLGALLAACLLLAGAACSRSHTVTTADGKVSYQDKGKDVPIYSPAKVVMSQSVSDKNARNLMLESTDASDKIVDFYKKGLDGNGWKTESTMTTAQLTILTASKDQRQVVLQITDGGAKRSVMQVVSDKH